MTLVYVQKLDLWVQRIDIGTQKIDDITLVTYGIIVINFSLQDKNDRDQFFEKIFLVTDTSIEIVLGVLFFSLFDTDVRFAEKNWNKEGILLLRPWPQKKGLNL